MELKDPRKLAEEWNSSTLKFAEGINKSLKELAGSKNLKEFVENVQDDISEIQDLTKKMYENNVDEARAKVLEKTEALQEKLQKFHEYMEQPSKETTENSSFDEDSTDEIAEDTTDDSDEVPAKNSNEKNLL